MGQDKKTQLEIRQRRIFSETFKRQKVQQIVDKKIAIKDLVEHYGVARMTVYRWLYQYSPHHQKGTNQVVQMESEEFRTQQLLKQIAELERSIGQKQLQIDYLEKLIAVSSEELKVDIKKNFSQQLWSGTGNTPSKPNGQ
jgi:transposase-like protein